MNNDRQSATAPDDALEPQEFTALLQPVYRQLWLIAAGTIGDQTEAEDIVQEAVSIAYRKRNSFRRNTNFAAWMVEIVKRCAANHRRKFIGRRTYPADPSDLDRGLAEQRPTVPVLTSGGELLDSQGEFDDNVLRSLQRLSEETRCCLLLRVIRQLSYREISQLLQIPEGTAMSHVHRGKAALRKDLDRCDSGNRTAQEGGDP